jgi:phosphoribosylformylglycinamidine synthase subunit PurQ / glutaminase
VTRVGVVTFPGSLDDHDARRAVRRAGAEAVPLWHGDADLRGVDAVILPGGFSYGDYLRCGAIARFAPVMRELVPAARKGLPVLGICNGFQILCEAHLLPGALTRNQARRFINRNVTIRIENAASSWTRHYQPGQEITVVLKSGEGAYMADEQTLDALEAGGQVLARYRPGVPGSSAGSSAGSSPGQAQPGGNPNGSVRDIAGVVNEAGNVAGLMPHPEHAIDLLTGPSADGLSFFTSVLSVLGAGAPA